MHLGLGIRPWNVSSSSELSAAGVPPSALPGREAVGTESLLTDRKPKKER